jgi:hypothetical protein
MSTLSAQTTATPARSMAQLKAPLVPDLARDLVLPTVLFMALGGMTWAVRGCSGFGAVNGCVFAGVTWGAAWWFISRDASPIQSRRYSSGWIILALTIGIGISGNRGWMQWPSFFEGHLQLNSPEGRFVPIPRLYGFIWLFIAGVPWAGLGACLLAWCASDSNVTRKDWLLRLGCGLAMALAARAAFEHLPEIFLPLYRQLKDQYTNPTANPNLRRLIGDNRAALTHLGFYLGFLVAEAIRRDRKNVLLIVTVGVVNGLGWSACQNWRWAAAVWPNAHFNWWRCWESCGGLSIGAAYGLAYFLVNRPSAGLDQLERRPNPSPNLERFGAYTGLILGLGLSIKNGGKGWANIYLGNEDHWNRILWSVIGPLQICALVCVLWRLRSKPLPPSFKGTVFAHEYRLIWLVLITQNVIAQMVTGPHNNWNETAFSIYYLLLMGISGCIIHHFNCLKRWQPRSESNTST